MLPNLYAIHTVMGKAEGLSENWHGHVTALSVSPDYRRLGLAATLMNFLEDVSEKYVITFSCSYLCVSNQVSFRLVIGNDAILSIFSYGSAIRLPSICTRIWATLSIERCWNIIRAIRMKMLTVMTHRQALMPSITISF